MLRYLGIVSFVHCIVIVYATTYTELCTDYHPPIVGVDLKCQSPVETEPWNKKYDYKLIGGFGYYKFHTIALSWNDARKKCIEEGAHLAIIRDRLVAKALGKVFKKLSANISQSASNKHLAWLGVHDQCKEGEFKTVFGDSFSATDDVWEKGHDRNAVAGITPFTCQPNPKGNAIGPQPDNGNTNANQDCAALIRECNTMDDNNCDLPYAFFCEIPNCKFRKTRPKVWLNDVSCFSN